MNIEGVKTKSDFEVIDITDESDPYITVLGIDQAFENNTVINLKKRKMSFETDTLHAVTPLNPYEGDQYNELVEEDAQSSIIENIYNITRHREDCINPTTDGRLSW